jgi:hypothetical protein
LEEYTLLAQKPDKLFPFSAHLLASNALALPLPWLALCVPGKTFPESRTNRFVGLHCPFQDHAEEVPGATVVRARHLWQAELPHAGGRARATAYSEKKTGGHTDLQCTQDKQTLRRASAQKRHQEQGSVDGDHLGRVRREKTVGDHLRGETQRLAHRL